MVNVTKHGIVIGKSDHDFESEGVLNPAVIKIDKDIHLFYRAVAFDNYSTIGYCRLSNPLVVEHRNEKPLLFPQDDYECQGLEDPRIVKIEDIYYLSYTAFDGVNALGALATSTDLIHWKKKELLFRKSLMKNFYILRKQMVPLMRNTFVSMTIKKAMKIKIEKYFCGIKTWCFFQEKSTINFVFFIE